MDVLHAAAANYAGGLRGRVDLDTGSNYAVWLFPSDRVVNLYGNAGWDINVGRVTLAQGAYEPGAGGFHTVKLTFDGIAVRAFYDGELLVEVEDEAYKQGTVALDGQDTIVHYDNVRIRGAGIPRLDVRPVSAVGKSAPVWGQLKMAY
ncbi:hypothetical protein CMK11_15365 [Candidatus Poribacteria bacterium]|nr:hypothetical protein [Candidatus Poribacteria bacterium]